VDILARMTIPPLGGMGWRRDLPDFRDYCFDDHEVQAILRISSSFKSADSLLPAHADLRKWCSRVEEQSSMKSSSAHAVAGLIEYFERRAFGHHLDVSRLFLYRSARDLAGTGDRDVDLRNTMRALARFGAPPEHLWPYAEERVDTAPPPPCYAYTDPHRSMRYFRLDPPDSDSKAVLQSVRRCLSARIPAVFGFPVYSSFPVIGDVGPGEIPVPGPGETLLGGHAAVAVGYDDERMIGPHQGALLMRNSWGKAWGDNGYGWLPYKLVEMGLAVDFWSLVRPDFVNTDLFN
jgi:C1A family cysteine protease